MDFIYFFTCRNLNILIVKCQSYPKSIKNDAFRHEICFCQNPNNEFVYPGTLLNSVVKELIERVLSLEDISEDSAIALTSTLNILKDNAEALFPVCIAS